MKYTKYTFIFTLSLLFTACDGDDSTPESLTQNDIQGNWILSELNTSKPVDLDNDGSTNLNLMQETTCFDRMKVNFEDDTYQFTYPKINFTGENNQNLSCADTLNTGTYILENNTLAATTTINNSTNTESVAVELANNQLKFTITSDQINENSDLEFLEFIFEK